MEKPSLLQLNTYRNSLRAFVDFTEPEWEIFSGHLSYKKLQKKDYFVKAGEVCTEVGYILTGSARFFHIKEAEEITGYFCMENDLISAYKSFLTKTPAVSYIQALENTELITFNHKGLQQLLADSRVNYKMERFGRLIAEFLICCYEDRVFSFVTESPEERYLQLLKNNRNILKRIPQHYIANYLGITPVSLSRIRKRIMNPPLKEMI